LLTAWLAVTTPYWYAPVVPASEKTQKFRASLDNLVRLWLKEKEKTPSGWSWAGSLWEERMT
jgi:hypothetical protein